MRNNEQAFSIDPSAMDALTRALDQLGGAAGNGSAGGADTAWAEPDIPMEAERPIVLVLNGREVGRALRDDTYEAQQGLDRRLSLGVGR